LPGSILGAAILTIVPQILQAVWEYRMFLNGILMVVLMIWRPEGILGTAAAGAAARERFRRLLVPIFGGENKENGA
jgi:branched-chain amino acid transport system permease protein